MRSVDVSTKNLEDHVENPDFLELLRLNGVEKEMFPLHPRPSKEGREAMSELDLTGWLVYALLSLER